MHHFAPVLIALALVLSACGSTTDTGTTTDDSPGTTQAAEAATATEDAADEPAEDAATTTTETPTTTAAPEATDAPDTGDPTSDCDALYLAEAEAIEAGLTAVRSNWAEATLGEFATVANALDNDPAVDAPFEAGCEDSESFVADHADTYPETATLTTSFLSSEAYEEPAFLESCESTVAWYEGLMTQYTTANDVPLTMANDLFVAAFSGGVLCAEDPAYNALTESAEFVAFTAPLDDL